MAMEHINGLDKWLTDAPEGVEPRCQCGHKLDHHYGYDNKKEKCADCHGCEGFVLREWSKEEMYGYDDEY
jgi:hypothetical protein